MTLRLLHFECQTKVISLQSVEVKCYTFILVRLFDHILMTLTGARSLGKQSCTLLYLLSIPWKLYSK